MRRSNSGFFLIDALLSVFICSCICILCFSIYNIIDRYVQGLKEYQTRTNLDYEIIFSSLGGCEGCSSDEPD
ncbi:MAG: hypothetical protein IKD94_04520 [Erysipelotrichaceae bacterium]|nr:hypothetical protein [Erysipelotrichaceae bacterium]